MSVPSKPKASETDASYCVFGTNILSKLLQSLQAQIQGVIESEEIEYVHKMRVASRRIRATMPLFQICFPKKKFKKWLTQVKKVTRLLGDARDLDVQIAFMQNYLEKLESTTDRPSLALLLKSYRDRRKTAQTIVESGLKELQNSVALKEMRELFEETDKELDKEPFHASSVREKAYWHIASRIDDFLELEKFVHQKNALLKHHEMRVKAKHLRYTMEAFSSLYKNDLTNEVAAVKEFQDALGEMHDSDVWIDNLKRYMTESEAKGKQRRKSKSPPIEDKQALLNFLNYLKDKKKDHYSHFTKTWAEKQQTNFFGKLRKR